jgi:hypothetical protein
MRTAACLAVLLAMGCGTTHGLGNIDESGFLKDYSMLHEGEGEDPQLIYINPAVDFADYDKILLEPVSVYAVKDSDLHKLPPEEQRKKLQPLVDYLHATLLEQLSEDYSLVDRAGPGTIRLRVAITGAGSSYVVLDTVSTVVPIGLAISTLKEVFTGESAFVGDARIEAELLDSQTSVRLAAGVDSRAGNKITANFDKFDKWHAVKDCFDKWALRLKTRLREESGKQGD